MERPENKARLSLSFVLLPHGQLVMECPRSELSSPYLFHLQAKPVWSLEGEQVFCLAADDSTLELATGKPDGSITFWDTQNWNIKATLLSTTGIVSTIKYGSVKGSKLPATFVLVS